MKTITSFIKISGLIGHCGNQEVFLGFASARVLHGLSFADILNEETGQGYQRPPNRAHSLDFKNYISRPGSSTIPLTFNLRDEHKKAWRLERFSNGRADLYIKQGVKCLSQVDCQHRLHELADSDVPLAFMTFLGLDLRSEMGLFVIINSKAKGLSGSLTDFHKSNLLENLIEEAPHLYIARRLNEDTESPWGKMIRYGGETTSGTKRRTSFRMMQKVVYRFLTSVRDLEIGDANSKYSIVLAFWRAISRVFPHEWSDHRHHLITKGIGLYSLTRVLTDVVRESPRDAFNEDYFVKRLQPLRQKVDWSSNGTFANAGGQKGALEVYGVLKGMLEL